MRAILLARISQDEGDDGRQLRRNGLVGSRTGAVSCRQRRSPGQSWMAPSRPTCSGFAGQD